MSTQSEFEFQRFKTELGVSVVHQLVSLDIGTFHRIYHNDT